MAPETRKAFLYLRKRGYCDYHTEGVWEDDQCVDIRAYFPNVAPNHRIHVRKVYPNAEIIFTDVI